MAILEVVRGNQSGQQFKLAEELAILGRHPDCDIVLDAGAVSRQHAQVRFADGEYFIEDLGSRNGTFVNEAKIEGRYKLEDQDRVQICDLDFLFHRFERKSPPVQPLPGALPMPGHGAVMDDDAPSTIMKSIDVSVTDSALRVSVCPEAKLQATFEITKNLRNTLAM